MKKENQREIKFRAWDTKDNTMQVPCDVFQIPRLYKEPRFVLIQFTGLKDKNGTEIYEGDIVSYIDFPNGRDRKYRVRNIQVMWRETGIYTGFNITKIGAENFEVIGNIWKSPELLK